MRGFQEKKIKFINSTKSRYFSFYLNGFPKTFFIHDILPVQIVMLDLKDYIISNLSEKIRSGMEFETFAILENNLRILNATSIASAADFFCLINYKDSQISRCSYDWLEEFLDFSFFDDLDHLEIVYIYFRCLAHGFQLKENTKLDITQGKNYFCPNPCNPINGYEINPCISKRNTKNHDCLIANKDFILYENNYKCNCKLNYEWDSLKEECIPKKMSCYGKHRCVESNSISCEIHMHSKEEIAITNYEYEISCSCLPSFMGSDCSILRNPCVENYFKNRPSGSAACGINGKCIPSLGTNSYECLCNPSWYDDINNDYLDCYEFIDKCTQMYCYNNGYCKASADNQVAICVCDQYYTGLYFR